MVALNRIAIRPTFMVLSQDTFIGKRALPFFSVEGELNNDHGSADAWGSKLLIYGGMGQNLDANGHSPREFVSGENGTDPSLRVLDELLVYDTLNKTWSIPQIKVREGIQQPLARYAHLSAISNGCLVILVGSLMQLISWKVLDASAGWPRYLKSLH